MMQIRLTIYDEFGQEVGRFPDGSWEPRGPDGISFGPGGVVIQAVTIPHPGRYNFKVEGLTGEKPPPSTDSTAVDLDYVAKGPLGDRMTAAEIEDGGETA